MEETTNMWHQRMCTSVLSVFFFEDSNRKKRYKGTESKQSLWTTVFLQILTANKAAIFGGDPFAFQSDWIVTLSCLPPHPSCSFWR